MRKARTALSARTRRSFSRSRALRKAFSAALPQEKGISSQEKISVSSIPLSLKNTPPYARKVMLACVSPCDAHYEETLGTLRYAQSAKKVKTRAVANSRSGGSGDELGVHQTVLVER